MITYRRYVEDCFSTGTAAVDLPVTITGRRGERNSFVPDSTLAETKLSVHLGQQALGQLAQLGEVVRLKPEEHLFSMYEQAQYLYVIVDGYLFVQDEDDPEDERWVGPGDIIGAIPVLTGRPYGCRAYAGLTPCTVWRLHRSLLCHPWSCHATRLMTQLLLALLPHLAVERGLAKGAGSSAVDLASEHCDYWHPAIQKTAALLRRRDPWETTTAIWRFVQPLPYRFGMWNLPASETLCLGYGMCTTKANLQRALMTACGIKCSIARIRVPSHYVRMMLPQGYRGKVRSTIKHYFAVVNLDGRWLPCDASFTRESLQIMADHFPSVEPCLSMTYESGRPFSPVSVMMDSDPTEFEFPNLAAVLYRQPFYTWKNTDAMNVLLDRAQGPIYNQPGWAPKIRALLDVDPTLAFERAHLKIAAELTGVWRSQNRYAPAPAFA